MLLTLHEINKKQINIAEAKIIKVQLEILTFSTIAKLNVRMINEQWTEKGCGE
jgi:hypothetical protein